MSFLAENNVKFVPSDYCTNRKGRNGMSVRAGKGVVASSADLPQNTSDERRSLPRSVEESVSQARAACQRAIKDGKLRLKVELLLPLIGATDLDDWPGGIQQQFKAASPLVSSLLTGLIEGQDSFKKDGGCTKSMVDDSDAVVAWESDKVSLLLFGTAETIPKLDSMARNFNRPLILANPQWQDGQVISDFGFGAKKRAAEALVNSFHNTYILKRLRIQSEDVRILKCYPGDWQIFLADNRGSTDCIAVEKELPSYKELEAILRKHKGQEGPQNWLDRLKQEFKFNQDTLNG